MSKQIHVREYVRPDGTCPFRIWLQSIGVDARANSSREARFHFGPGYRLYFAMEGKIILILLCGGDKRTQQRDIRQAKSFWLEYQARGVK